MHHFFELINAYLKPSTPLNRTTVPGFQDHRQPLRVLIDGETCLERIYGGLYSDWICGGEWSQANRFLRNLCLTLLKRNIEVIIYFNETIVDGFHMDEWERKQKEDTNKIKTLYTYWVLGEKNPGEKEYWLAPVNIKSQIAQFARKNGHQQLRVFKAAKDYKEELLQFYIQNKCHALFTDDFGILIYIYSHYHTINVYSAKSFKLDVANTTIFGAAYDLDNICKVLGLQHKEFPLFATLSGYGYLNPTYLYSFYARLLKMPSKMNDKLYEENKTKVMLGVIDYVKKARSMDLDEIKEDISKGFEGLEVAARTVLFDANLKYFFHTANNYDWICQLSSHTPSEYRKFDSGKHYNSKFETNHEQHNKNMIVSSPQKLNNPSELPYITLEHVCTDYDTTSIPKSNNLVAQIRNFHVRLNFSPWIYQVYTKKAIFFPVCFELSESTAGILTSHQLYKPIRERAYTLLFSLKSIYNNQPQPFKNSGITVSEWYYSMSEYQLKEDRIKIEVDKEFKTYIENYWCRICTPRARRLEDFMKIVGICDFWEIYERKNEDLFLKRFLVSCLVLKHMFKNTMLLQVEDIKAFLATLVSLCNLNESYLENINVEFDARALHLTTHYLRGVENLQFVNDICGRPLDTSSFDISTFFSAKLFKLKYVKAHKNESAIQLCNGNANAAQLFNQLLVFITKGINYDPTKRSLFTYNGACNQMTSVEHRNVVEKKRFPGTGRGVILRKSPVRSFDAKSPDFSRPAQFSNTDIFRSFDDDFNEIFENIDLNNSHERQSRKSRRRKSNRCNRKPDTPRDNSSASPISTPSISLYDEDAEYEMPPEAFTIEDVHRYMGIEPREFLDENGNKKLDCGRRLPRIPDEENIKIYNRNRKPIRKPKYELSYNPCESDPEYEAWLEKEYQRALDSCSDDEN